MIGPFPRVCPPLSREVGSRIESVAIDYPETQCELGTPGPMRGTRSYWQF